MDQHLSLSYIARRKIKMFDRQIYCVNCGGAFSSEDTTTTVDSTKRLSYHRCPNCSAVWHEDMEDIEGFSVGFLDSYEDLEEEEDSFWK